MSKRLLIGLLSAALALTLVLPGAAVAKKDAPKDACKKGGWEQFEDSSGASLFADQGECVAYVAEGGTLPEDPPPPPTDTSFETACTNRGGTFIADYGLIGSRLYGPMCQWYGITKEQWTDYSLPLHEFCVSEYGYTTSAGFFDPNSDPDWKGCYNDV